MLYLQNRFYLHYLRTNITVTYVSQFRQLISYLTALSYFQPFAPFFLSGRLKGAYFSPPYQALTWAVGPVALLGRPWGKCDPYLPLLLSLEETRHRLENLQGLRS